MMYREIAGVAIDLVQHFFSQMIIATLLILYYVNNKRSVSQFCRARKDKKL